MIKSPGLILASVLFVCFYPFNFIFKGSDEAWDKYIFPKAKTSPKKSYLQNGFLETIIYTIFHTYLLTGAVCCILIHPYFSEQSTYKALEEVDNVLGKWSLNPSLLIFSIAFIINLEYLIVVEKTGMGVRNEVVLFFTKQKRYIIRNIKILAIWFAIFAALIYMLLSQPKPTSSSPSIISGAFALLILLFLVIFIVAFIYYKINESIKISKYRRLIRDKLTRSIIHDAIANLAPTYQTRYVRYLEFHVKTVTGEWPDPLFLSDKNSEAITRLAKLEEKWLGLDR